MIERDTIAAIATPVGEGGIGIVRISGFSAHLIGEAITQHSLQPRIATFCNFYQQKNQLLDKGLAIFFKAPHSYTGEDVVELQAHGNPVILDLLIKESVLNGARLARPGEFTERAFLNGKLDLAQAEAVADLIAAGSEQAVKSAQASLQGKFSEEINLMLDDLINIRTLIEAYLDFPEEDIEQQTRIMIQNKLLGLQNTITKCITQAQQGVLLTEGMTVALVGKPNAGKSSLINCLAKKDVAIVTPVAGTTRDALREYIQIDGLPLHIIDTAGLRATNDLVELEGIRRTHQTIEQANLLLLVEDITDQEDHDKLFDTIKSQHKNVPIVLVKNKCDLLKLNPTIQGNTITLSAKTGDGISLLCEHLKKSMGYKDNQSGVISARRRHILALEKAFGHFTTALQLCKNDLNLELQAEELRLAQQTLEVITGKFLPDDLLGKIFSEFCIGK